MPRVFFHEPTARALVAWLEIRPQDKGDWLFTSFGGKSDKLTTRGVSHMLMRRGKRAGCKGSHNPHAFRHGFARHFLRDGGDLGALCDILGHSDVAVTKAFYGIYTTDDLQEKHDRHSPLATLGGGINGD
jgi:site-specific recombinase XerD